MYENMKDHYGEVTLTKEEETKAIVRKVVDWSYEVVCSTMGPNSGLVLINSANIPYVTKDGVSAARSLNFGEHRHNLISELITSAALRVDEMVGDGTTTTVFMVKHLYDAFSQSNSSLEFMMGDKLINKIKEYINEEVIEVNIDSDYLRRMVNTTTNYNQEIADTVLSVFNGKISPNVKLVRNNSYNKTDVVEVENDIFFEGKHASAHIRLAKTIDDYDLADCQIILVDGSVKKLPSVFELQLMNHAINNDKKVIIIAREFENEAIAAIDRLNTAIPMCANKLNKHLNTQGNFVMGYSLDAAGSLGSNIFKDIGTITDTYVLTILPGEGKNDDSIDIYIGDVKNITVANKGLKFSATETWVKERTQPLIKDLLALREKMTLAERSNTLGLSLQKRISALCGENVTITVTGLTSGEITERFYLYEDAVKAVKTSLNLGVVPGIGYTHNRAAERLVEDVIYPLSQKENKNRNERITEDLAKKFVNVLTQQYKYLLQQDYVIYSKEHNYIYDIEKGEFNEFSDDLIAGKNLYLDLITGDEEALPANVFDNGGAAAFAIESAWSVIKNISRLKAISGKPNTTSMATKHSVI